MELSCGMLLLWNQSSTSWICSPSNLPGLIRLPERSAAPLADAHTSRASIVVSAGIWNYPWFWRVPLHPELGFHQIRWGTVALCTYATWLKHFCRLSGVHFFSPACCFFFPGCFCWNLHYIQSKSPSFIILPLNHHLLFKFSKKSSHSSDKILHIILRGRKKHLMHSSTRCNEKTTSSF